MPPGITFDVLKRVGSPLSGARVPLLSPHRAAAPVDRPPPPSASNSPSTPPSNSPAACSESTEAASPPLLASNLPSSPQSASRASMPMLTPRSRQSTLDRDSVEGTMTVQLKRDKKKRKQLLPAAKASYFVVSDASKPVIEIYTSEARTEMVFLLSLAGAEMSFEADNANIVMEKCFCVEVKTWKRKNTVFFKHQGFLFFEEDQARMLLWVKCIHSAIKKAATVDGEVFRRTASGSLSPTSPFRDYERLESDDEESTSDVSDEPAVASPMGISLASASGEDPPMQSADERVRLRQSLSIDPNYRASSPASTSKFEDEDSDDDDEDGADASQGATSTVIYREPRTPLDRFNLIFSGQRQGFQRFPKSPAGNRPGFPNRGLAKTLPASYLHPQTSKPSRIGARIASNLQSKLAESTVGWVPAASPPSGSSQRLTDASEAPSIGFLRRRNRAGGGRGRTDDASVHPLSPSTKEPIHYPQLSTMYAEVSHALSPTRLLGGLRRPKQAGDGARVSLHTPLIPPDELGDVKTSEVKTDKVEAKPEDTSHERLSERNRSLALQRFVVLAVANVAGAYHASLFLPLAAVGLAVHVFDRDDQFVEWACVSVGVFLASCCHALLGSCLIFGCLFLWSYAEFQVRRRARRNAEMAAGISDSRRRVDVANLSLPNWMAHPDVDRVDWLNDVFVTGWPYLKVAIRDSILNGLNPVLDAQRPAFISALSISRIELGDKPPQLSGVKFVAASALTDEVTVDIAVRVVTDESFAAELKLVSNLGAAASVALRDLFLVGTLRLTLNPLIGEWPCFSGLTLSFTSRPVFDFSLTAAKINLANVPFASEWLQTFLHELLVSHFVWPKVLHIPLWEDAELPST